MQHHKTFVVPAGLSVQKALPDRIIRRPSHSFQLRHKPYQLQPFLIAPVLAGETMKNLMMQARVVTSPIKNPLIGWWLEYYLFYIPLRSLFHQESASVDRAAIETMLLDLTAPLVEDSQESLGTYSVEDNGVGWVQKCLDTVVDAFFRNEGETIEEYSLDGMPIAQIQGTSWLDSVTSTADLPEGEEGGGGGGGEGVTESVEQVDVQNGLGGSIWENGTGKNIEFTLHNAANVQQVDVSSDGATWFPMSPHPHAGNSRSLPAGHWLKFIGNSNQDMGFIRLYIPHAHGGGGGGGGSPPVEVDGKYQTWLVLRQQKMTMLTFEDYLLSFGVRPTRATAELKPEVIRHIREWSYPSNTINPANGAPSSAVSWAITERADKDRFFREPGFIFGVTVSRPKIYLAKQVCAAVSMLTGCLDWLPASFAARPDQSMKLYAPATGPLATIYAAAAGYWVDLRDLFTHGDQFVNFALTESNAALAALPVSSGTFGANSASRYPSAEDVSALFVGDETIRQDGVVNLHVLGTQQDYT